MCAATTNWTDHSRINKHDHRAAGAMPPVKKYLFVSQVENTEEVEDVRNFLESNNIHPMKVEKISHNLASYHSFKVCVRISDSYKMMGQYFWEEGIKCEEWKQRRNNYSAYGKNYNKVNNDNDSWENISYNRYIYY